MSKSIVARVEVQVGKIATNPWNDNVQSEFMFDKTVASISEFGFIDPVTVRDMGDGTYQIINGEHRWKAAKHLKLKTIPADNLGQLSEERAKALTEILNNLGGEADQIKRAELLQSLADSAPELLAFMPYGDDELRAILESNNFDWNTLGTDNTSPFGTGDGESGFVGIKVSLNPQQHKVVTRAFDAVRKEHGPKTTDAEVLVELGRSYLATSGRAPRAKGSKPRPVAKAGKGNQSAHRESPASRRPR